MRIVKQLRILYNIHVCITVAYLRGGYGGYIPPIGLFLLISSIMLVIVPPPPWTKS